MQSFASASPRDRLVLWPLRPGESLSRWHLTEPERTHFPGTPRPMPDAVDYRFVNGWVATGDLPCREALRGLIPKRSVELPRTPAFDTIHLGGENPRVDFSTFCFRPTLIGRWARCVIASPKAQSVRLAVETRGGVHLWCDERKLIAHEPFDRNRPHRAEVSVALDEGRSVLTAFLEDLHERDTSCYFQLTLIEGDGLEAGLEAEIDPGRLRDVEATLNGLRTERLFHAGGTVGVVSDHLPAEPLEMELVRRAYPDAELPGTVRFTISRDLPGAELFQVAGLRPGCLALTFRARLGGIALERELGTTLLPPAVRLDQPTLSERKRAAIAEMQRGGGDNPARALLLLATDHDTAEAERLFRRVLAPVNERHDCADFALLPLIWAWRRHAGTITLWAEVRDAILNFRYWLDEPGNDVMWFWSENHVLCFHVAQYLAGDAFPAEVFPNSGRTGAEHRQAARDRLRRWFDSIEEHGLAEWNSAAYYPIDLLGLFTLMENAPDPDLAGRARALIDRIFAMIALHTIGGVPAGSQGRAYEKELFAGPATELGAVAAIAFGGPWCAGHERAAALFAISGYVPPASLARFVAVPKGRAIEARYAQGLDHDARLALWKSADAQLSTVAEHRTGARGHQEHVADLQLAAHPLARLWVNHPGELRVWGGGRPSYWAGNGIVPRVAQHGNVALIVFDLARHAHPIDFTHAFCPTEILDEAVAEPHWIFARAREGYAALFASGGLARHEAGLYRGSEWRSFGRTAGWLMIAGSAGIHGGFASFRDRCHALAPRFDAPRLTLSVEHPDGPLSLPFDGALTLGGITPPFKPVSTVPHVGLAGARLSPWNELDGGDW